MKDARKMNVGEMCSLFESIVKVSWLEQGQQDEMIQKLIERFYDQ